MRAAPIALVILLACAADASAQGSVPGAGVAPGPGAAAKSEEEARWSFAATVYTYVLPDEGDYAQPAFTADRGWLHLEARYNYEDLETGSLWMGYTFGGGEKLAWEVTPMLGGVFGNTAGVAPGYRGSLRWRSLEFYSEGEYVFDARESSDDFFYNWSELTLAPSGWFRFGMVTQRTRVYRTERDIHRGLLAGVTWKGLDVTTYVFDPDTSRPTVVIAAGVSW
jgi:hypothetical protein